MLKIPFFQVDAFSKQLFCGNPAAVCPLKSWLPDKLMQQIANENNLSETVFFVPDGEKFNIRWFTPNTEINLCGHATLATAHVLWNHLGYKKEEISFLSKSGELVVNKSRDKIILDFPTIAYKSIAASSLHIDIFGDKIYELYQLSNNGLMAVLEDELSVKKYVIQKTQMLQQKEQIFCITAKGTDCDFVSRVFAPAMHIDEDPVTGSLHCSLTPYWSQKLNKSKLYAKQLSSRGGELWCEDQQNRVTMVGNAITFLIGEIVI
ncbi:MAG: PhzF family phenazine biosynthesis protein [Cytophagales bacterium]|nr:MAG: PhzF family phenazine biosynthesis protein [Cytophagales bacterium]